MTRFATVLVPNMPIAVVRRDEPALAHRPILLYEDRGGRATIVAAEATAGLVGLPLRQAATRCPAAVVRRAQPAQVAQAVRLLRGVLDRFSPRVARQQQGADVALIAGLGASSMPAALALAARLLAAVQAALRLSPALGLAATPAVAHMAARIAGAGAAIVVPVGQEAAFLAPQPIALLPIVPAIAERLRLFGLRTIGAVARLPRDALEAQFGIIGGALHDLAHGRDQASLWVAPSVAQVGVRRHFAGAVLDARVVLAALDGLAAALAVRLEAGGWAARTLTLTVTLVDDRPQVAGRTSRSIKLRRAPPGCVAARALPHLDIAERRRGAGGRRDRPRDAHHAAGRAVRAGRRSDSGAGCDAGAAGRALSRPAAARSAG